MQLNKIHVSHDATVRLRQLKGRTGLTPNLLARLGFCLSLNDPSIPNAATYEDDGQEFNRYTLTGEWDPMFVALLKERCRMDGLDLDSDLEEQFRAHLNRGVFQLFNRVKDLSDLEVLLPAHVAQQAQPDEDATEES